MTNSLQLHRIYINGRFLTQSMTGVQRFAYELTRELAGIAKQRGVALEVLVPSRSALANNEFPELIRRRGWFGGYLWEQMILPFISRGTLLVNLGNVAPLAKRRQVVLVYDASPWTIPFAYTWQFRAVYKLLIPFVGRNALGLATISKSSARDISRYADIPIERIGVLRAGAEHILRVAPTTGFVKEHGLERPFVLAVGSLSPNKNFGGIVRAFNLIKKPSFDLVIVGGSESMVFAKSAIQASDRVKSVGRVTDGQLRELYERATLFVFPSFYEGLGLPPMEAMVCGCPVLLSDIPVFREVWGDTVPYCDPSDDADIAAKMTAIMDQPSCRLVLRDRGLKRVLLHNWHQGAEDLMDLIQRVNK